MTLAAAFGAGGGGDSLEAQPVDRLSVAPASRHEKGMIRQRRFGTVDRILRNLRFDLGQRKVLLVFDEAQHLSIECLETIRELLDQPPHCGLLFAGTHELEEAFTRQALELDQWRSRFHAGQALPGISKDEAAEVVILGDSATASRERIGKWPD